MLAKGLVTEDTELGARGKYYCMSYVEIDVLDMNNAMQNAVMSENNLETLRNLAIENGMVHLWDSCCNLVVKGVTSIQELMSLNIE